MHFPILDKVGRFLEPRKSAFKNIESFDRLLDGVMTHASRNPEKQPDVVSFRLKQALDSGQINLEQYQANLRMMFMVGHDNTEFLLTSAMWELGKNTVSLITDTSVYVYIHRATNDVPQHRMYKIAFEMKLQQFLTQAAVLKL